MDFKTELSTFVFHNDDATEALEFGGEAELTVDLTLPFAPYPGLKLTGDSGWRAEIESVTYQSEDGKFCCDVKPESGYLETVEIIKLAEDSEPSNDTAEFQKVVDWYREEGWSVSITTSPEQA